MTKKSATTTPAPAAAPAMCCPALNCSVLTWADAKKTGTYLAAINAGLLLFVLDFPIFYYLSYYFYVLAFGAGAYLKFTNQLEKFSPEGEKYPTITSMVGMTEECAACLGKKLFSLAETGLAKAAPVIFWEDAVISATAAVVLYCASIVVSIILAIGVALFTLVVVNGLFAYGKFEKEVNAFAAPHVVKAKAALKDLVSKIPVHKKD